MIAPDPTARSLARQAQRDAARFLPLHRVLKPSTTMLVLVGDSTIWQLTAAGGFNQRLAQLTSAGGIAAGLAGWVNLGSSGWSLNDFVTAPSTTGWNGPSAGTADWNLQGTKTGTATTIATSLADLAAYLPTIDPGVIPVVCLGLGHNDWGKSVAVGTLPPADLTEYFVTRFRTAAETIRSVRSNAIIRLIIQNRVLARPYVGTVPVSGAWNAAGAPGFGTDLAADTALLAKVDAAQIAAKDKVAAEFGFVDVWNWQDEVTGTPNYATETPTTWPAMVDNGHPSIAAHSAMADSICRLLFGNRLAVPSGRLDLADRVATAKGTLPEETYPKYCEGRPERYSRIFDGLAGAIGSNYLDLGLATQPGSATTGPTLFTSGAKNRPIYIQVGDGACQRFTGYTVANQTATGFRLLNIAPNAAMQALSAQYLPIRIYVDRETSTGNSYVDGEIANLKYRKTYLCTISAAGSGTTTLRLAFDGRIPGMFRQTQLATLAGLKLVVGANATTYDLGTANFASTGTPSLSGNNVTLDVTHALGVNFSTLAGPACLALDQTGEDPAAKPAPPAVLTLNSAAYTPGMRNEGGTVYVIYGAGAVTLTLPADATAAIPVGGRIRFISGTTQPCTFAAGTGATVTKLAAKTLAMTGSGAAVWAEKVAANTWTISGDLA